jgi:RNA-directed DNA polymerase
MSLELAASPEELKKQFYALRSFDDVATLLEIQPHVLYYHTVITKLPQKYKVFYIPKNSGGMRRIAAPISEIKIIQWKLNQVLQAVYVPKASVHGFVPERSILTNANRHLEFKAKRRFVFNLDLSDFFPTITYVRVRGLFHAQPYGLPQTVSSVLAKICCCGDELPQGAPTSPIIANMICAKMDTQLRILAQANKCVYTRYADDITFSTTLPVFPHSIGARDAATNQLQVGNDLRQIIENNGFKINDAKVRLHDRRNRQEVTGLTINVFPNVRRNYVRQIRAMLHAWEKYGLDAAEEDYFRQYSKKKYSETQRKPSFKQVVRGKLEFLKMVRGSDNLIYLRFSSKLAQLDPDYKPFARQMLQTVAPARIHVLTEGKTDWKHLKAALLKFKANGEFTNLDIEFWEKVEETANGDGALRQRCEILKDQHQEKMQVCIFDRDKPDVVKVVTDAGKEYKYWGNRVYSFALPVPSHRLETPDVCIELYYQDSDIRRCDSSGRRLFLSNEFDKLSFRHLTLDLNCTDPSRFKPLLTIIDNKVFNSESNNVALPKDDFATNVLQQAPGFVDVDISEFRKVFEVISKIVSEDGHEQAARD